MKTEDTYVDIARHLEKRFDTSNYESERPLPSGENKKVIGLMEDELDAKNNERFCCIETKNT